MADIYSRLAAVVKQVAGTDKQTFDFRLMEVVSVDGDTCTAKIDEFEIPDIRLASIVGGAENGILVTPAKGSIVAVADLSCGQLRELLVVGYSEIDSVQIHRESMTITADTDKVRLEVGKTSLELTDTMASFNGGKKEGLVVAGSLQQKLNTIEQDINDLKRQFAQWTPTNPEEPDASALKVLLGVWAATPIEKTKQSDIENTAVKH